jgi:NAD(P) transhydrogenase subunit alpha
MVSSKLNVCVIKEIKKGETRVAATPITIKNMIKDGLNVFVESGAGSGSFISDKEYEEVGAKVVKDASKLYSSADIVLAINPPENIKSGRHQLDMLKNKACWISSGVPQNELDSVKKAIKKNISFFSLNLMPRITRAQKMDILSSQSSIAGYKAVLLAADSLSKMFPLMMTAAGTIQPAKMVVVGAGVAGLQAVATAKRLGAQVEVSDVRPAVKEQVESLGAKFIDVVDTSSEDSGGYAKEASEDFKKKQAEELSKSIARADVVITTALIPGKKAPLIVTENMIKSMKTGSVIVDLAAEQGGNCALTKKGETVEKHGIKILGELNLPSRVSVHATQMYAQNIYNFLQGIIKEGKLNVDLKDEVVDGCLITYEGKIHHKATADLIGKGGKK